MRTAVLSNFLFLRFIAAALVTPKAFGLTDTDPLPQAQRALTLISKVISNAANNIYFGEKESYMTIMNDVILQNQSRMSSFLEGLVLVSSDAEGLFTQQTSEADAKELCDARDCLFSRLSLYRTEIPQALKAARAYNKGYSKHQERSLITEKNNPEILEHSQNLGEESSYCRLIRLLDLFVEQNSKDISDEDRLKKKAVEYELLAAFEIGTPRSGVMHSTTHARACPSKRLLRLLLKVESERTKELEQELRSIKSALHSETQMKKCLQHQKITYPAFGVATNGIFPSSLRQKEKIQHQFMGMHEVLENLRVQLAELEGLLLSPQSAPISGLQNDLCVDFAKRVQ